MTNIATATTESKSKTDPPDRLPTGVQLPDGRTLTYPPSAECSCYDCVRAFEAHREGTLRMPEEDGLPW